MSPRWFMPPIHSLSGQGMKAFDSLACSYHRGFLVWVFLGLWFVSFIFNDICFFTWYWLFTILPSLWSTLCFTFQKNISTLWIPCTLQIHPKVDKKGTRLRLFWTSRDSLFANQRGNGVSDKKDAWFCGDFLFEDITKIQKQPHEHGEMAPAS